MGCYEFIDEKEQNKKKCVGKLNNRKSSSGLTVSSVADECFDDGDIEQDSMKRHQFVIHREFMDTDPQILRHPKAEDIDDKILNEMVQFFASSDNEFEDH